MADFSAKTVKDSWQSNTYLHAGNISNIQSYTQKKYPSNVEYQVSDLTPYLNNSISGKTT